MPSTLVLLFVVLIICLNSTQSDAKQFEQWYWKYRWALVHIGKPTCQPYYTSRKFPSEYKEYSHPATIDACKNMATCLLRNLDDIDKADMQSATVLLGLTPTIISYVGPTVVDIALVSSYRPVLATLTGLGAPAIFPTRLFKTVSPEKRLEQGIWKFALEDPAKAFAVTAIEYLLLGAAIVNSLLNSWWLGHRTILSWSCLWSEMESLWNFLPLLSYICAGLSLHFSKVGCYTTF